MAIIQVIPSVPLVAPQAAVALVVALISWAPLFWVLLSLELLSWGALL